MARTCILAPLQGQKHNRHCTAVGKTQLHRSRQDTAAQQTQLHSRHSCTAVGKTQQPHSRKCSTGKQLVQHAAPHARARLSSYEVAARSTAHNAWTGMVVDVAAQSTAVSIHAETLHQQFAVLANYCSRPLPPGQLRCSTTIILAPPRLKPTSPVGALMRCSLQASACPSHRWPTVEGLDARICYSAPVAETIACLNAMLLANERATVSRDSAAEQPITVPPSHGTASGRTDGSKP